MCLGLGILMFVFANILYRNEKQNKATDKTLPLNHLMYENKDYMCLELGQLNPQIPYVKYLNSWTFPC